MKQQHTLQPKLRFPEFEGDWEKKGLKDIGTINRGKSKHRPRNDKRLYGGDIPFIQTGDVNNDKLYITEYTQTYTDFGLSQSKLWDENTLCITIAANIANTSILKFKSCFPDSLIGFIANDQSDIIFIKYTFDKIREELKKLSQGVAQDNLNLEKLNSISTLIPSLPEQQKIADYLSTIDTKINLLEEKKAQLALYKKAMMQKLFTQEIRFKPTQCHTELVEVGIDEVGALEAYPDWEEKRLGEVFNSYNGLTGKTKENFGFGKPYIKYTQIFNNSKIDIQNFDFVEINDNDNQNLVEFGDAFFTVSSETPHEVGMSSVLLDKVNDVYLNSFCFGIRPKSENVNPFYYRYFFRSKNFRKEVVKLAQGSTRYNMSKVEFMKIFIQIPSLPEQQKIADFLSAIDESIEKVTEQISKTQSFKKAMLQQMFV